MSIIRQSYPPDKHGKVLGLTSLSFSIGDAFIRIFLGELLILGFSWQSLFLVSAICASILAIPGFWIDSPDIIEPEKVDNPVQVNSGIKKEFWVLMAQAPLFTWMRELFSSWSVVFLSSVFYQGDAGKASMLSVVLPLFAAISSVVGGYVIDKTASKSNLYFSLVALTCLCANLFVFSVAMKSLTFVILCLGLIALFSTAPGSWSEGLFIFSVAENDFGLIVGSIHCAGYLGAILAGSPVGFIVHSYGWLRLFQVVALVSLFNCFLTFWYTKLQK